MALMTCEDLVLLSMDRDICLESARLEAKALAEDGYVFNSRRRCFYKKIKNNIVVIMVPTFGSRGRESYETFLVKLVEESIAFFIDEQEIATIIGEPDKIAVFLDFFDLSLNVHQGQIIGLEFDF